MGAMPLLADAAVPEHVTTLASKRHYEGAIMDVVVDQIALADGQELRREFIEHDDAVGVLALRDGHAADGGEGEAGEEMLLIRQYRHPVRGMLWEIPAGLLDIEGEDPAEAARRELYEEADLVAGSLERLVSMYASPGCSTELYTIYAARGCAEAEVPFERTEEEAEIERRWVPVREVLAAVRRGDLHSPTLVSAVLAYAAGTAEL